MTTHHADLSEVFDYCIHSIAEELFKAGIIAREVQIMKRYESMIGSFVSAMNFKRTMFDLERHCVKFLKALSEVGGPVAAAADMIREEWTEAVGYQFEFLF